MGSVHYGRMAGSGGFQKTVAIKRLHAQFAKDGEFRAMFLDEARLASRIHHPNAVGTLDVVDDAGELFLILEYVHGEALSRLTHEARRANEPIDPEIAASIITGALYGLHAAHEASDERGAPLCIVHRDVSPQNILVGPDGVARVLDFGIAKAVDRLAITRAGQTKGKIAYMAPEQIADEPVDRRADVFAAAVVMWELLSGERLFHADSQVGALAKVMMGNVPRLATSKPELPAALDDVLLRALSRHPRDRHPTARDLARAIEEVLDVASPAKVGDWVSHLAGESLRSRTDRLRTIETQTVASLEPAAPLGEATAILDQDGVATEVLTPVTPSRTGPRVVARSKRSPERGSPKPAADRYPSVTQYLAALPNGLASFPDAQVKAAVLLDAIQGHPVDADEGELPSEMLQLLREPPPVSSWVPEVLFNATMLATFDQDFAEVGGERAFLNWVYRRNLKLLDRPFFRVLFKVVSPSRLLIGAKHRWSAFHRGTKLDVVERDTTSGVVLLSYPATLFPSVALGAFGMSFRAAAETAGAKGVVVERTDPAPGESRYALTWR